MAQVPKFLRVTKKVKAPRGGLKNELTKRVREAGVVAGRAIAEGLKDEVLARIPRGTDKWLDLYRDAIQFLESRDGANFQAQGGRKKVIKDFAVAGLSRTKLTTVPAESTQIMVKGSSTAAAILAAHNPWTVDTLPAISGGTPAEAEVRPASESEMESHRSRLRPLLPAIINQLQSAGYTVTTGEFPRIAGKVFMDLRFLQLRLEHGLGGFKRTPHWTPAARQAANKAREWVQGARGEIQAALDGEGIEKGKTMSVELQGRLEKRRKKTWL